MRAKAVEYMDRAEALKQRLSEHQVNTAVSDDLLVELQQHNASLAAALKLIEVALYKDTKRDFAAALEHYEKGLALLFSALKGSFVRKC